jgi:hypothetical protein
MSHVLATQVLHTLEDHTVWLIRYHRTTVAVAALLYKLVACQNNQVRKKYQYINNILI